MLPSLWDLTCEGLPQTYSQHLPLPLICFRVTGRFSSLTTLPVPSFSSAPHYPTATDGLLRTEGHFLLQSCGIARLYRKLGQYCPPAHVQREFSEDHIDEFQILKAKIKDSSADSWPFWMN